jgi:hypothetical protein
MPPLAPLRGSEPDVRPSCRGKGTLEHGHRWPPTSEPSIHSANGLAPSRSVVCTSVAGALIDPSVGLAEAGTQVGKHVAGDTFVLDPLIVRLDDLLPGTAADDRRLQDEVIHISIAAGVVVVDGAQRAVLIDVVAMPDERICRPRTGRRVAVLPEEEVEAISRLRRISLPVGRARGVLAAQYPVRWKRFQDRRRYGQIRPHVHETPLKQGCLPTDHPEVQLVIRRVEIDLRIKFHMNVARTLLDLETVFAPHKTAEVRRVRIRKREIDSSGMMCCSFSLSSP